MGVPGGSKEYARSGGPQWMRDMRAAGEVITMSLKDHCKDFDFDSE